MMIATWPPGAPRGAVSAFCARVGISRSQFYAIRAMARRGDPVEAVLPERPPRARPDLATPAALEAAALRIRKELQDGGWDAGPITVREHMLRRGMPAPSRATLARIFARNGQVVPQPQKRPRSSWRRFTFAFVHECWQLDATQCPLADGGIATVFQLLDDHSRYIVGSWVDRTESGAAAEAVMRAAVTAHQAPQLLLTDNGMAMNPRRRGRGSPLLDYADSLGVRAVTSSVYHPQTLGKNERVHQTLKRWLLARALPTSPGELTELVAQFDEYYNQHRPHQALGLRTPAEALQADPRAVPPLPPQPPPPPRPRSTAPSYVRTVRVMRNGCARALGGWINLGIDYAGHEVISVVEGRTVSLFDLHGTHLRTVQTTPGIRYYGTGRLPSRSRRDTLNPDNNQQPSDPTET